MKLLTVAGLLCAGLLVTAPSRASDKQAFEACDGRLAPGKQDDGMRGEAGTRGYAFNSSPGSGAIEQCTIALASPRLLPTQTLRRAHLLRARAATHLTQGNAAEALADIDAAEAATVNLSGDRFFQRSMGVSLKLLRAFAYVQSDRMADATDLARAAMEARPYALAVQMVGAAILQGGRPIAAPSPSPWLALARLDPAGRHRALSSEADVGNFAAVLAIRPLITLEWPEKPLQPVALMARTTESAQLLTSLSIQLHVAYARAATGDATGARNDIAELKRRLSVARRDPLATPANDGAIAQFAQNESALWEALDKFVELRSRQIEMRIAVSQGHRAEAISALIATPPPRDAATIELLTALKASSTSKDATMLPDVQPLIVDLTKAHRESVRKSARQALIAPETTRAMIDYARARPNILGALVNGAASMGLSLLGGIDRTDGFRSTANADGTTKVEFIGATPSAPVVQEMTLLRAAEIARAAGKAGFVITNRQEYSRRMTTTRGGIEISSIPSGFKSELTIRFVDAGAEKDQAFDALAVIDALGPLYYEEKQGSTKS